MSRITFTQQVNAPDTPAQDKARVYVKTDHMMYMKNDDGLETRVNQKHGADIASAGTLNLDNSTGDLVDVTGTTTVTVITLSEGKCVTVRFTGSLTLTNGASLVLPTGANIVTSAGDFAIIRGYASGVVRCVMYQTASGTPLGGAVVTGAMLDFAGTSLPSGYLGCDGSAVSRSTYATLFTAIGTTWGAGDGSTTFNLPDFRRRAAVGSGGSGTGTLGNAIGNTGGAETHTLSTAELASHTHPSTTGVGGSGSAPNATPNSNTPDNTGSAGSGTAHSIMQPSAVVFKIIKT